MLCQCLCAEAPPGSFPSTPSPQHCPPVLHSWFLRRCLLGLCCSDPVLFLLRLLGPPVPPLRCPEVARHGPSGRRWVSPPQLCPQPSLSPLLTPLVTLRLLCCPRRHRWLWKSSDEQRPCRPRPWGQLEVPGRIQDREGQCRLADCCKNVSSPLAWPGSDKRGSQPNASLPSAPASPSTCLSSAFSSSIYPGRNCHHGDKPPWHL